MAGCKRCALNGVKREREKEEKRKGKRRKNGDQNRFFFHAHVFSYAQWSFFNYIRKTVSRLSRSYLLLFAIKSLIVSQFVDL